MAVSRHLLALRSKDQRSRSRAYAGVHVHKIAIDILGLF